MLQNRIYRGEIVHNEQSYPGEDEPIVDQPLWNAVQARLAGNAAQRNDGGKTREPSLLAGVLFDGDGNRMTPSHAVKKGTRYRYYVSRSLITKDRTEASAGLRIPAAEIEQLVTSRVHRWLLDPGSIYKSTSARLPDSSMQQQLIAQAGCGNLIASGRHQHPREAIRRGPQTSAPAVDQARRHIGLLRHIPHRTGPERRRHNGPLLLDAAQVGLSR
jgi:Recombinase